jgi:RHS repeat-associated protein
MFAGKLIAYSIDGTLTTTAAGHLGSTEITNTAGTVNRQTYLPYGSIRSNTTNQLTTDRTYTGQTDDGLGWMHYRARQYDPTLGRFLQADTITVDGLNRYTYVRNNPLNATDPTGMCSEIIDGACVIWGNGWSYNHGMVMPSELRAAYLYSGNGPSTRSGTSGSRGAAFIRALAGPGIDKVESGLAKVGTCLSATLHGSSCSKGGVTQIDRALGSETAQILTGAAEIGVGTAMIISPTASNAIQCYEGVPSGCAGLALAAATAGIVYGGAAWFDDLARATNRATRAASEVDQLLRLGDNIAPSGWSRRIADNGQGTVWQRPGAIGNADMLRIMEPTDRYPNGYARFYNQHGQPLNLAGKPASRSETHIPLLPDGSLQTPVGWP